MSRLQPATTDDGLTSDQLREVARKLLQHAGRYAETEAQVTAFLDRADEIRAEARAMDQRRRKL